MQVYPAYGYEQQPYVLVEEDSFMKEDKDSTMKMMRPDRRTPTQPLNRLAPPHRGSYYDGMRPGKGGYRPNDREQHHLFESFKADKPSYGGNVYDYGGYYKYDYGGHYTDNASLLNKGGGKDGGYHHGPPHMPPVLPNESAKPYGDDYRLDGGYKYDCIDNASPLKKGGGRDGGYHHGPPHMPPAFRNEPVKPYGDDYRLDGGYKYDYIDNVSPSKKGGGRDSGYHHGPPTLPNAPVKPYGDDYRVDGGYKYDYMDNPSPLKMGGGGNGGHHHGPPQMPPLEHYGDDYDGENSGHYWDFRGIDD